MFRKLQNMQVFYVPSFLIENKSFFRIEAYINVLQKINIFLKHKEVATQYYCRRIDEKIKS